MLALPLALAATILIGHRLLVRYYTKPPPPKPCNCKKYLREARTNFEFVTRLQLHGLGMCSLVDRNDR